MDNVITKEHFVSCIECMRELDDMASEINETAMKYGRNDFISGYAFDDADCQTKLMETLEMALGDKEHWVSWYCLEANYGRDDNFAAEVTIDGKTMELRTPEDLYDYLTSE